MNGLRIVMLFLEFMLFRLFRFQSRGHEKITLIVGRDILIV